MVRRKPWIGPATTKSAVVERRPTAPMLKDDDGKAERKHLLIIADSEFFFGRWTSITQTLAESPSGGSSAMARNASASGVKARKPPSTPTSRLSGRCTGGK